MVQYTWKEKRQYKKQQRKLRLQQQYEQMTEEEKQKYREEKRNKNHQKQLQEIQKEENTKKLKNTPPLVLDFYYVTVGTFMNDKLLKSLKTQVQYSYNRTRMYSNSLKLTFLDYQKDYLNLNELSNAKDWQMDWTLTNEQVKNNPDKYIYLSADADDVATTYDNTKTYIIGALVDHNQYKYASLNRAKELGIKAQRIDFKTFVSLVTSQVLTVNQMVDLVLKWKNYGIEQACKDVVPLRKEVLIPIIKQQLLRFNLNFHFKITEIRFNNGYFKIQSGERVSCIQTNKYIIYKIVNEDNKLQLKQEYIKNVSFPYENEIANAYKLIKFDDGYYQIPFDTIHKSYSNTVYKLTKGLIVKENFKNVPSVDTYGYDNIGNVILMFDWKDQTWYKTTQKFEFERIEPKFLKGIKRCQIVTYNDLFLVIDWDNPKILVIDKNIQLIKEISTDQYIPEQKLIDQWMLGLYNNELIIYVRQNEKQKRIILINLELLLSTCVQDYCCQMDQVEWLNKPIYREIEICKETDPIKRPFFIKYQNKTYVTDDFDQLHDVEEIIKNNLVQ